MKQNDKSTMKNSSDIQKLINENTERLKELSTINRTTQILKEGKPVDETLQQIVMSIPSGWQYPEYTCARIKFDGKVYRSPNFIETQWVQYQGFTTIDNRKGSIEVFYIRKFMEADEGPFLKEERDLINNLTGLLSGYLNSMAAKALLGGTEEKLPKSQPETKVYKPSGSRKKLLQRFLNKNNQDRDIYHDLMPFKVKEILLVANLYDAYSIEREGRFSEHVLGEYYQLNLTSVPRITGVSSPEEVFEQLGSKHFDMVILMMGADKKTPLDLSVEIKKAYPYIPTFLLLNNNGDIEYCRRKSKELNSIDKVFVWNGESQVFFAMIKHVEDKINVENDTRIGLVRVILLVEDSAKYYSRYLPMLYNIVMEQTRRIIDDVSTDELYKVLKLRARPKILLAETYEDAANIINKYKDYMLCLISDVKFEMNGQENTSAGYELIKFAKDQIADLPTILQSSEQENASLAHKLRSTFINKNSESLMMDFKSFITHFLGFGNFIYRDKQGNQISTARSLKEFEKRLKTIPDESLLYHARRDHFSLWLMARGEIQAAKILNPSKVTDFEKTEDLRKYLIEVIQKFRNEQNKGKIIPFEENAIEDESNVVSLSGGSLGGKGRGLAFINTLINNYDFGQHVPDIHIRAPKTSVIGTEEFEYFLERNHLRDTIYNETDYPTIKEIFLNSRLTDTLVRRLKIILKHIKKPIAVRSSGLFEDSLMQPFAGIFDTYLLPNSHPDTNVRLEQLKNAIKLVYASVFSETARGYISAVNYQIEEEKMAVVLQEVVGHEYDGYFYPHISGVAQSYNYYPFAHMKPEEGFAVAALGLGKYVVDGEKAYRFSPKYPNTDINTPKDQFKNSQVEFLAVDLNKSEPKLLEGDDAGLSRLDIDVAERHGTLRHLASVYDRENERIVPGLTHAGPRIINFANIFKYNYIPLAQTIEVVMDVVQEALGSPVEIEFAVDLKKDQNLKASFYLLQIKPLLGAKQGYEVNMKDYDKEQVMLYSEKVMGNGLIDDITDVVYVDPRDFDKAQTKQMAKEIDELNQHMRKEGQKYVLIGPGRWGTRDPWIGIPVNWPQISEAKVIVETSLEGYPLDASSGSHFFHNVTSMNVGYFSVQPEHSKSYINFDVLRQQQVVSNSGFFTHVKFDKPLEIKMDGKQQIAVITHDEKGE